MRFQPNDKYVTQVFVYNNLNFHLFHHLVGARWRKCVMNKALNNLNWWNFIEDEATCTVSITFSFSVHENILIKDDFSTSSLKHFFGDEVMHSEKKIRCTI